MKQSDYEKLKAEFEAFKAKILQNYKPVQPEPFIRKEYEPVKFIDIHPHSNDVAVNCSVIQPLRIKWHQPVCAHFMECPKCDFGKKICQACGRLESLN